MRVGLPLAEGTTAVFARATKLLLTEDTVASALRLITDTAAAAIPGAVGAGVPLLEEGPCTTAWASGACVIRSRSGTPSAWPRAC